MSLCSFAVPLRHFLLSSLSLALVGCVEIEEKFTLNPDGSGKFAITEIVNMKQLPDAKIASVEELVSDTVKQTKGVDVWAAATGKVLPDGRWEMKLQGYFKDFSGLKFLPLHPKTILGGLAAPDNGKSPVDLIDMKVADSGIHPACRDFLTQALIGLKLTPGKESPRTTPAPPVNPKLQASVNKSKPFLAGCKVTTFINFGEGEVTNAETFTRVNAHTVKLETDFGYMAEHGLTAMAAFTGPNADLRQSDIIAYANCAFPAGKDAKGIPSVAVKTKGPAFPYAEESAKAKASQAPALKKLLEEAKAAPGKK